MAAIEQAEVVFEIAAALLGYLLLVQVLMAACLMLGKFVVLQWRSLRALLARPPAVVEPQDQGDDQPAHVVIGGPVARPWD